MSRNEVSHEGGTKEGPDSSVAKKKGLSSNLLGMKFMRRAKEAELRAKLRAEQEEAAKQAQWVSNEADGDEDEEGQDGKPHGVKVLVLQHDQHPVAAESSSSNNNSNSSTPVFTAGRRSFGRFNVDVEKQNNAKRREMQRAKRGQEAESSIKNRKAAGTSGVEDMGKSVDEAEMAVRLLKKKKKRAEGGGQGKQEGGGAKRSRVDDTSSSPRITGVSSSSGISTMGRRKSQGQGQGGSNKKKNKGKNKQ